MSRDEISVLLHELGSAPVEPNPQLQQELGSRLLHELDDPRWSDRFRLPQVQARIRHVALATAGLAATAALTAGVWFLVEQLQTASTPIIADPPVTESPSPQPAGTALTAVLDARVRWLSDPRPVHLTSVTQWVEDDGRTDTATREVWVREDAAWRTTTTQPGSSTATITYVWDGRRQLSISTGDGSQPGAELFTFVQTGRHPWGTPTEEWLGNEYSWQRRCATGELLTDAEVAGRVARHVRCGQEHLWLDVETGLLLRHERPAGVDDGDPSQISFEVTSLDYDPAFQPGLFSTDPPSGIEVIEFTEPPHVLVPGQPAPAFEATTADGQTFSLGTLRGRHVLVVFWSPGLYDLGVVEQVHAAGHDGLTIVVYDRDRDRMPQHADYVGDRGYTVPVVYDAVEPGAGSSIGALWREPPDGPVEVERRQSLAQFWVLVGPDGRVIATRSGTFLPEHLEDWLFTHGVAG